MRHERTRMVYSCTNFIHDTLVQNLTRITAREYNYTLIVQVVTDQIVGSCSHYSRRAFLMYQAGSRTRLEPNRVQISYFRDAIARPTSDKASAALLQTLGCNSPGSRLYEPFLRVG